MLADGGVEYAVFDDDSVTSALEFDFCDRFRRRKVADIDDGDRHLAPNPAEKVSVRHAGGLRFPYTDQSDVDGLTRIPDINDLDSELAAADESKSAAKSDSGGEFDCFIVRIRRQIVGGQKPEAVLTRRNDDHSVDDADLSCVADPRERAKYISVGVRLADAAARILFAVLNGKKEFSVRNDVHAGTDIGFCRERDRFLLQAPCVFLPIV